MSDVSLLVVAPYPLRTVPGQRFRFEQYLDVWRDAGIRPTVRSLLDAQDVARLHAPGGYAKKALMLTGGAVHRISDLAASRRYDAAFVFREAFPVGPPLLERAMARLGVRYILDFDDAIWLTSTTEANRRFGVLKFAQKLDLIAARAALVTVGNEYLAAWARRHQSNVRVLPTTIDTSLYRPIEPSTVPDRPVTIGWSGSSTTVQHLRMIEDVLREVQRQRAVRIRVIGDATYRLSGATVEALPWRESTEVDDLAPIDIGIMPLPDDEWARGKCGLKALQYMALGIPTVMSPVGVNREIAAGDSALLASTHHEWREVLLRLIDDVALRRRIGALGRERVVERYSVDAVAPAYVDAVLSVVGRS